MLALRPNIQSLALFLAITLPMSNLVKWELSQLHAGLILIFGLLIWLLPTVKPSLPRYQLNDDEKHLLYFCLVFFILYLLGGRHVESFDDYGLRRTQWDNQGQMILNVFLPFCIFALISFARRTFTIKHFYYVLLIATIIGTLIATSEYFMGASRSGKFHKRIIDFAMTLMLYAMMLLALVTVSNQFKHKALTLLVVILAIMATATTGTRGGWIALPSIMLVLSFYYKKQKIITGTQILLACIAILALLYIATHMTSMGVRFEKAFDELRHWYQSGFEYKQGSVGSRIAMWKASWQAFLDYPIFGIGEGNLRWYSLDLREQGLYAPKNKSGILDAHSSYFAILSSYGIVGVFAYGSFFIWLLRIFKRHLDSNNRNLRALGLTGIVMLVLYLDFGISTPYHALKVGSAALFSNIALLFILIKHEQLNSLTKE